MTKIRVQTGAVGSLHEKVYIGSSLKRVEADYYAARVLEKREPVKNSETKKYALREIQRSKSTMTKEVVANIRWLREKEGWYISRIAQHYNIKTQKVDNLCRYVTWSEIDPCKDGLDFL